MSSATEVDVLAEAHGLSAQLLRVAERARNDFADVVGELGLTPQQARAVLWLDNPSAMRTLAEHLACDASNVTGIADRLEESGLVERVPGQDRRVKLLRLTTKGVALRADLADRVAAGSTVTAKLTSQERTQLAALLDKLLA
ncbi:MarR family winged helix-turn-helix transcriptional regulator [Ornithinimicrobium cryptoxanthini]|uniref:MarR family transcriptional regulator n=1 Tax=Ornithinimicrobium cryptoxanthini TaxID=2934161 RepID=A0ABY4YJX1_9MICO|nr:MarR family transcriptional regulator [Ornithinimicrobium cryptoxanthini]USQ76437.1 MarR family transcriptional regulator [Ornithinimicrobium cryptoxanthini]